MSHVEIKLSRGKPRKIVIPTIFDCLGHKITVQMVSQEQLGQSMQTNEQLCGYYDHDLKTIYLGSHLVGTALEQTFQHELIHCLLEHAGHTKLSENESFVDLLSELLYQFLKTQKGNLNGKAFIQTPRI